MDDSESPKHPPVDPWGEHPEWGHRPVPPTSPPTAGEQPPPPPMYGRAQVRSAPLREPTAEMPPVTSRTNRPPAAVSWRRTGSASRRSLGDGWGLTATGLLIAFCGWGVWAAAGRGSIASPLTGLAFMLIVAAGVFGLSRLLGYVVLTQMLQRQRLHARWSHLLTGLFLTAGGISYLANTGWVSGVDGWIGTGLDWLGAQWQRI